MGFVMDGLDAESYDRTYDDRQLVKRIAGYFAPKRKTMLFVAGLILISAVTETILPIYISRGLDAADGEFNWAETWPIVAIIVASGALAWLFNYFRQRYTADVVADVVLQLREDVFGSILERDMSFYDHNPSGKIVSRITGDTRDFATVVTLTLNLMSQVLLVLFLIFVLFFINARLAWLALTIAPIVVLVALGFRQLARLTTRNAQRALATVNAHLQETISGISVAKNFRQEQTIYDEFKQINGQSYHVGVRQGFVFSGIFPALIMVAGLGSVIIVYFGASNVISENISPGDWFLFVQAISLFWFPLTSIASFWSQFQQGLSASERVFALMDAESTVQQTDSRPLPSMQGEIKFKNVDFSYTQQEQVLAGFNLTIPAGQTIALVGHTGAGKSSLGKLVTRFYEFQSGQILVDGQDVRSFAMSAYRHHIGVVLQTPFLFSGTVADNIRYARPEATDEEVLAIAHKIGWGEWLDALPDGLNSNVGEGGQSLSMGQRQLVALARVLLKDPAIIILDEATASVDPVTEAQIQESLDIVLQNRTAIVIAHRLSTIKNADRVIVLQQGDIIEEGTHDQLMSSAGHYADLYNTYFRHQSADFVPSEISDTAA